MRLRLPSLIPGIRRKMTERIIPERRPSFCLGVADAATHGKLRVRVALVASMTLAAMGVMVASEALAHEPDGKALPVVVDVGAAVCVPCRMMKPVLERASEHYAGRAVIRMIDVRKDREALKTYGVRVLPTQIFFNREGERVAVHEGFLSEAELIRKLDQLVDEE